MFEVRKTPYVLILSGLPLAACGSSGSGSAPPAMEDDPTETAGNWDRHNRDALLW